MIKFTSWTIFQDSLYLMHNVKERMTLFPESRGKRQLALEQKIIISSVRGQYRTTMVDEAAQAPFEAYKAALDLEDSR